MNTENESAEFEAFKDRLCKQVVMLMDFTKELDEGEIYSKIDDVIIKSTERKNFDVETLKRLRNEIYYSLKKYDVLQEYLENDEVTEIMINGPNHIFVEKGGHLFETGKCFASAEKLEDVIQQMVAGCNRTVNEATPIADARLSSGERVNIVLAPVALNGPIVTIRRFPKNPITMDKLISMSFCTAMKSSRVTIGS